MIKPMLCEEVKPFDSDDYSFEVKLDGERALLYFEPGSSGFRTGRAWT